jgi:Ca2+ transporting ATPase
LKGNDWLEKSLCTSFSRGITGDPEDLEERNRAFGNNIKPETEMKSFIELFLDALEDFTLRILLVAACISIIIDVCKFLYK